MKMPERSFSTFKMPAFGQPGHRADQILDLARFFSRFEYSSLHVEFCADRLSFRHYEFADFPSRIEEFCRERDARIVRGDPDDAPAESEENVGRSADGAPAEDVGVVRENADRIADFNFVDVVAPEHADTGDSGSPYFAPSEEAAVVRLSLACRADPSLQLILAMSPDEAAALAELLRIASGFAR